MRVRVILLVLLAATCVAWGQEDEQFLLRYKWNAGEEITWNVVAETTGTVLVRDLTKDPVDENEVPIWSRVTMPMTLTVEGVDEDGNVTVLQEIGTMQMDIEAEGETKYIVMDPKAGTMTTDGEEQPLPEGTAAGMAGPFRIVISPRGEMLDMELPKGFGMMMGGLPGMDMDEWMKMSQGWAASFPEEAIGIGYVWGAPMTPPVAIEGEEGQEALGNMTVLYRLLGVRRDGEAEVVQIEMLGAMDFETLPFPGIGAMPGEGGNMEMTMGPMHVSISGTIDFDPEAGALVASDASIIMDMVQHMKGTVETPEGVKEINTEIITRDMKVNSTVEAAE